MTESVTVWLRMCWAKKLIAEHPRELSRLRKSKRSPHWVKVKNPKAPAVKREAEEDWGH
jgi:hypothetical protein